jgi:hypothetical protein
VRVLINENNSNINFSYRALLWWSSMAFGIAGRACVPALLFCRVTVSAVHHAAPAGLVAVFKMTSRILRAKFQSKLALVYRCHVHHDCVGACVAMTIFVQLRLLRNETAYCNQHNMSISMHAIHVCIHVRSTIWAQDGKRYICTYILHRRRGIQWARSPLRALGCSPISYCIIWLSLTDSTLSIY